VPREQAHLVADLPPGCLAASAGYRQYVRLVTDNLLAMLGIYGGTFIVSIIAGFVPLVNSELFLVGLVRFGVDRAAQLPGIVVAAATGQMVAKIGLYFAGMGMLELPRGRYKAKIELVRAKLESWKSKPYLVYAVSSVVGLPPMYLTVLAAGAMKIRFKAFLVIGLAGRLVRFAFLVAVTWAA
jgi:membrane protein YqaA with SNARE-associated domain